MNNEELHKYLFGRPFVSKKFTDLCQMVTKISDYQRLMIETWINDFTNDAIQRLYSFEYIMCLRCVVNPFHYIQFIEGVYNKLDDDEKVECVKYFKEYFNKYPERFRDTVKCLRMCKKDVRFLEVKMI